MKLSVIVPVYNTEKYIEKCLNSIKNQTLKDWECIVIDDGSSDNSGKICDKFAAADPRFKVVHKYNEGVSAARNLGIYLSKGDWIGFVDSDDYISPERYEETIKKGEELNVSIVKCSLEHIRLNGTKTKWFVPEGLYNINDRKILSSPQYDNSGCVLNVYRASLIKKHKIKFGGCNFGEDLLFNIEAYTYSEKLYSLDKIYYHYQRRENSLSTGTIKKDEYIKILNTYDKVIKKLSKEKSFAVFKPIVEKNFFERKSMKELRKNSIDYVVPYVDSSDPAWIKEYNKYSPKKINQDSNGLQRFRADDELFKYQLRGLERYMPWIDVVHLLVMSKSQVPLWINKNNVHIVYHEDFIPKKFLPVFNSSAIEMFLGKISGVAEKFIYGNDDFYYVYDLFPKFFFEGEKIKTKMEPHPIGDKIEIWKQTFINSFNLANYGTTNRKAEKKYIVPPHVEQGFTKAIINECYNKYEEEILNSCTRFRDNKNLNQYLFSDYAVATGKAIDGVHSYRNFNSDTPVDKIIAAVRNENKNKVIRSFVMNDVSDSKNNQVLLKELQILFPNKSKYEV